MTANPFLRVAAALALVGVISLFVGGSALHRLVGRLRENRALIAREEELGRSFEQLLRALKENEGERAAVESLRPRADQPLRFVEGLEGAAARAFINQEISAIPPAADQGGQPYVSPVVRFRVTLQGTMEKVTLYLSALQRLPELVAVERMELRAPPDGHVVTNATADLLIAVAVKDAP